MFRSLRMKLILVFILLIVSVMAVLGTFVISSVASSYTASFFQLMDETFSQNMIMEMVNNALSEDAEQAVSNIRTQLSAAYTLGISQYRGYYILDGAGRYLDGTREDDGRDFEQTPNISKAIAGEVGQSYDRLASFMDIAIPLKVDGQVKYIVGVRDDKVELNELTWNVFTILIRSIFFGLVVAVLLSMLLSKTITEPVERLTVQAQKIAAGDFSDLAQIYSNDEIGVLTETFNEMAQVLNQTLKEVQGERNKLNTLFVHMADGVVAFDSRGRLIHINPAACMMLGKQPKEGASYSEVFVNLTIDDQDLVPGGTHIEVDYAAGNRILKVLIAAFESKGSENGLMAVIHDITEQDRLEKSRREFVANVSHELHTPLTSIKGYTETLLDAGDSIDSETRHRFLDVVHNESDRMTRIVRDLLVLSRLDSNRMEIRQTPVDLGPLLEGVVTAMQISAGEKKVQLVNLAPKNLPIILGDRERCEQLFSNIISNAIKYNREKGKVEITGGSDKDGVYITVMDTGIGIPKEDLPRIFERFYRVDKARSRKMGGTGLGLAISKEIVEGHGGTIVFESEEDIGSTVTVTFPHMNLKELADGTV